MNNYNTQQEHLILKEYGRNIQRLVQYVVSIEDKEKRSQYAHTLVELMRQITPNMKDSIENSSKLWDDLYILSGFTLEIENSPFPMPEKTILGRKPRKMHYNTTPINFRHYGRNIELLVVKTTTILDLEEKLAALVAIGKLMRSFYTSWNKDNLDNDIILDHIEKIAKRPIEQELKDKIKAGSLFESTGNKERTTQYANTNGEKNGNNGNTHKSVNSNYRNGSSNTNKKPFKRNDGFKRNDNNNNNNNNYNRKKRDQ